MRNHIFKDRQDPRKDCFLATGLVLRLDTTFVLAVAWLRLLLLVSRSTWTVLLPPNIVVQEEGPALPLEKEVMSVWTLNGVEPADSSSDMLAKSRRMVAKLGRSLWTVCQQRSNRRATSTGARARMILLFVQNSYTHIHTPLTEESQL